MTSGWLLSTLLIISPLSAESSIARPQDLDRAGEMFQAGKFAELIELADAKTNDAFFNDQEWSQLKAQSQLELGRYADAKQTIDTGLQDFPDSIRLRWMGSTVYLYNNDLKRALELNGEIGSLWAENSWAYRDVEDLLVIGRYRLARGDDAKRVLDEVYAKIKERSPNRAEVYLAIGELALDKDDYQLAATNFAKAVELESSNPDAHYGLARAFRPSLPEKATAAINRALEINPHHAGALLLIVEQQLSGEDYDAAESSITKILKINPECPEAWAFRAVLAHLNNDPKQEFECRNRGLKHWPGNPRIDYLIGRELSRKYRFQEGSTYQRRALVYDPEYLPARMQLAHDLLRLGQELEGWKLAGEVFDADQYNVVANNLVALGDHMSRFATIQGDGFIVRMDRREAAVYGYLVLELLVQASELLTRKYAVELEKPIFIEIFSRQQDFAIRTFGLPGGAGYLGVCFGRVVTMNSPAAPGASPTDWRSVLWHEFCHVITLQKTKNKMPRWLSEGISVYEERQADRAWGDDISPRYREMILNGELTPVSKLSSAFLSPSTPEHLQLAYYQSSLVVQFLIEQFGEEALTDILQELSVGTPINDALRRHAAPPEFLDKKFEAYATAIATNLAASADWTKPKQTVNDSTSWAAWLKQHPDNIYGLLGTAKSLLSEKKYQLALEVLDRFHEVYPDAKGAEQAYQMRAAAQRNLGNSEEEIRSLEKILQLDGDDDQACARLLEIYLAAGSWDNVTRVSRRLLGINPMLKSPHRALAAAAEATDDDPLAIQSLTALVCLDPFDRADIHFRLASAQFRQGELESAKRNILLALEAAPRYRDAHRLLLRIVAALEESGQRVESSAVLDSEKVTETDELKK